MGLKMTLWEARTEHLWENPIWKVQGPQNWSRNDPLGDPNGTPLGISDIGAPFGPAGQLGSLSFACQSEGGLPAGTD